MKKLSIAVVGATGAVGRELFRVLEQRQFPVSEIRAFASPKSAGKELHFRERGVTCRTLESGCFLGTDIAFFDVSDALSREWVPRAVREGAWVIDNSATFRYDADSIIIVPEVNGHELDRRLAKGALANERERIICGPNCSTAQLVVALWPIHQRWGLRRVVVSTYQSTSGAGAAAVLELRQQTQDLLSDQPIVPKHFLHPIGFNCIPQIGSVGQDLYTSEETKMLVETRKIMNLPGLPFTATCVRVPIEYCHSESVNVELDKPFLEVEEIRAVFREFDGIQLQDDPGRGIYPMPRTLGGTDAVFIGRVRRDPSVKSGINFWIVADNLRKGAALNAVQIAEQLIKKRVF